jgi:two-component system phosphate regulon sensor histidine kinase PhoR
MENHADRPEIRDALSGKEGLVRRYSMTLEKWFMYVALPVRIEGGVAAAARASKSLADIQAAVRTARFHVGLAPWGAGLVITLLAFLHAIRLKKSVGLIRNAEERIRSGDFAHRIHHTPLPALDPVADGLNAAAAELMQRIEAVSRERDELDAVLSSMTEGVIVIGPDDRVLRFNRAAESLFRLSAAAVLGRPVYEAVRHGELLRFLDAIRLRPAPAETDMVLHETEETVLHVRGTAIRGGSGPVLGVLMVCDDVTRLRRLETMRRDFVANVTHELKTPITSIQGFVETLKAGAIRDAQDADRFLGIVLKHTERLNALIDDLLRLSHLERETDRGGLVFESGSVARVLADAAALVRPKAERKGIGLEVECSEAPPVRMNADLLVQAVANLADNAIAYSEPGGHVEIRCAADPAGIRIEVEDRGCGIAAEHLPRLFERFYRVDPSRSRNKGGTGLGLAIVKHIAQAHGGSVSVASEVGKGSTFTLFLPALAERGPV